MEWARKIKAGIDNYNGQVVPGFDQGEIEVAGIEMRNSIMLLEEGYQEMLRSSPDSYTLGSYTVGLIVRFELFSKYALREKDNLKERKDNLKRAMDKIEERIDLVELVIKPFLDK